MLERRPRGTGDHVDSAHEHTGANNNNVACFGGAHQLNNYHAGDNPSCDQYFDVRAAVNDRPDHDDHDDGLDHDHDPPLDDHGDHYDNNDNIGAESVCRSSQHGHSGHRHRPLGSHGRYGR